MIHCGLASPRSSTISASAPTRPRTSAIIIGAGAAGLAAGSTLADRGIEFVWFERNELVTRRYVQCRTVRSSLALVPDGVIEDDPPVIQGRPYE